jgi:hypothetical protein
MHTTDLFFGLFLAAMAGGFVCAWKANKGIVSDYNPYSLRGSRFGGRRSDYSDKGWRYRRLTILAQALALLFMLLWGWMRNV